MILESYDFFLAEQQAALRATEALKHLQATEQDEGGEMAKREAVRQRGYNTNLLRETFHKSSDVEGVDMSTSASASAAGAHAAGDSGSKPSQKYAALARAPSAKNVRYAPDHADTVIPNTTRSVAFSVNSNFSPSPSHAADHGVERDTIRLSRSGALSPGSIGGAGAGTGQSHVPLDPVHYSASSAAPSAAEQTSSSGPAPAPRLLLQRSPSNLSVSSSSASRRIIRPQPRNI